jgi:hypothetical protein
MYFSYIIYYYCIFNEYIFLCFFHINRGWYLVMCHRDDQLPGHRLAQFRTDIVG